MRPAKRFRQAAAYRERGVIAKYQHPPVGAEVFHQPLPLVFIQGCAFIVVIANEVEHDGGFLAERAQAPCLRRDGVVRRRMRMHDARSVCAPSAKIFASPFDRTEPLQTERKASVGHGKDLRNNSTVGHQMKEDRKRRLVSWRDIYDQGGRTLARSNAEP